MKKLLFLLVLIGVSLTLCVQNNNKTETKQKAREMKNYVAKIRHAGSSSISICFYIEQDRIMAIGEKMESINDNASMNGYNWETFLNYYLKKNYPDVCEGMSSDPEAGMYVAYYKNSTEDEKKADKLVMIIEDLIENESQIYKIVEMESENIEWN